MDSIWNLGILLDSQVTSVSGSALNQLRLIDELCPYLDEGALRMLIHALVISRIDYFYAL